MRRIVGAALEDKLTVQDAIQRIQENLKNRKAVVPTLEFAARVNREIGIGSEQSIGGVTFTFISNINPDALRRRGRDRKDSSASQSQRESKRSSAISRGH